MSNPTTGWSLAGGLARRIRDLRKTAGLTGLALAEKLDWQQSKVSKIENGKQVPSEEDIRALVLELGGGEEVVDELLDLREQTTAIDRGWKRGTGGGHEAVQRDYDDRVRAAKVIRNLEVTTIPGLLQTREYAQFQKMQAVRLIDGFTEGQIGPALELLAVRQEVLRDSSKRFEFLITEAALRLRYCPVDMMVAQLGHLLAYTYDRPNLWFGILPFGAQLTLVPENRFIALDDEVLVEHFAGAVEYREDKAAVYLKAWELAAGDAVAGDEARKLIVAAMRSFD